MTSHENGTKRRDASVAKTAPEKKGCERTREKKGCERRKRPHEEKGCERSARREGMRAYELEIRGLWHEDTTISKTICFRFFFGKEQKKKGCARKGSRRDVDVKILVCETADKKGCARSLGTG